MSFILRHVMDEENIWDRMEKLSSDSTVSTRGFFSFPSIITGQDLIYKMSAYRLLLARV